MSTSVFYSCCLSVIFVDKFCWKNSWSEGEQFEENTGGDRHKNISSGTRLHERFQQGMDNSWESYSTNLIDTYD